MSRRATLALLPAAALLVAACSSGPTASTAPSSVAPEATASGAAATIAPSAPPASMAAQTAAPTSLDPCQLVTASEASALAGASYSSGKSSTTGGGAKICTYSSTTAVVNVLVTQAGDASTAQADWTQEQAQAEAALKQGTPPGMNLNFKLNDASVTGADKAAVATASGSFSGVTLSISAIYVLKGATFFSFSDLALGHAAAPASTLEAQAVVTLGRIP